MRSVLDRSDHEDVRLHQPRCHNASAYSLRGYMDTLSPLVAMHHLDRSCVIVGFFLKLPCSPTVASEPGLCVDVICTSRTQRVVGDNSHTAYHQRLTLIRQYCWMKRPRSTLHDRVHETGSTDVLCTQVAGGCQFLQLLVESSVTTPGPCSRLKQHT